MKAQIQIILIGVGCLLYTLPIEGASLWESIGGGYSQMPAPVKSVIDLPELPPLKRYATKDEQRLAEEYRFKALCYKNGAKMEGYPKDEKQALLCFHTAAQYGEPTSCTLMAGFYRQGRYGLGPDEARAKMYAENMQWWERPRVPLPVAPALPAVEAVPEAATATDSESGSRRSSGDSDKSSGVSIAGAGEPASVLRHRGGPGRDC